MSKDQEGALFPIEDGNYKMDAEPVVRIGIVLEEDKKEELRFQVPSVGYLLEETGTDVLANSEVIVRCAGDKITLYDLDGGILSQDLKRVRIVPPAAARPEKAGDGVLVRGIVSGRGFHWSKEIDQTLSDVLEFLPRGNKLILVNEVPLETYLVGTITGEMSGECPIEFMKAQAVAARSWLLGQTKHPHPGEPFIWCNDDDCQRYQGTGGWSDRAVQAVSECRGEVLITESKRYCDARYSKNTGGISEDAGSVWGDPIEGLESRVDAPEGSEVQRFFPVTEENLEEYITGDWLKNTDAFASPNVVEEETITRYLGRVDEPDRYFRWTRKLTQNSLRRSLRQRGGLTDLEAVMELRPGKRGKSGRLEELHVSYRASSGEEKRHTIKREFNIRAAMDVTFLYSSAFLMRPKYGREGELEEVTLHGAGWGHGAGLCQIGALGRALKGQDYRTILMHYYSNVKLERIYD